MDNFEAFCEYFNGPGQKHDHYEANKIYFDAYCSFMVSRKYDIDDIKKYRMNSVIDYFMDYNDLNPVYREDLRKYYQTYIKDTFNKTLNAPRCIFYEEEKRQREEQMQQQFEDETDEVNQHYRELASKYKYFADLVYKKSHPEPELANEQDYYESSSTSSEANDYNDGYSTDEYECDDGYDQYDNDEYMSDDDYY